MTIDEKIKYIKKVENKKIFILNGTGGSGKDTFVDLCRKYSAVSIYHISTVTPIKSAAYKLGWSGEKDESNRKFLSDLKDLCTKQYDTSFKYIIDFIFATRYQEKEEREEISLIFIDCREPEEIKRLTKALNAITIYIDAEKRNPIITSNHADKNVINYSYDIKIDNNGNLEDFEIKAKDFINNIKEHYDGV